MVHMTNEGDAGRGIEGARRLCFSDGDALVLKAGELGHD
jgi:hypothetical protein